MRLIRVRVGFLAALEVGVALSIAWQVVDLVASVIGAAVIGLLFG